MKYLTIFVLLAVRLNDRNIPKAMERMMHKVLALTVKMSIICSLICPSKPTMSSRLTVSVVVEWRILQEQVRPREETIFKKVAKVGKNIKFE